jgi:tRNA pseudouridine55 synthase
MNGILLVDKASGKTSHDVIDDLRRMTGIRTIGHAGTLDPMATGLLIVAIGSKVTRFLSFFEEMEKEYEVTLKFGILTDTLDIEGKEIGTCDPSHVTEQDLRGVLGGFVGDSDQQVPNFSAVRVGGRRLYELAREGTPVQAPVKRIKIHALELLKFDPPLAQIHVRCSKGTYVRALARDIAAKLSCVAICQSVRRTKIGPFGVEGAVRPGTAELHPLPIEDALSFYPKIYLDEERARKFRLGQTLEIKPPADLVRVFGPEGFVGIGSASRGRFLSPRKIFGA